MIGAGMNERKRSPNGTKHEAARTGEQIASVRRMELSAVGKLIRQDEEELSTSSS